MSYPCIAFRVELNLADGMYELHLVPEDEVVAELPTAGAEAEHAEDSFASTPIEGKPRISGIHPRSTSRPWTAHQGTYSDKIRTRMGVSFSDQSCTFMENYSGQYRVELCNSTRLGLRLVTLPSRVYKVGQGPPSTYLSQDPNIHQYKPTHRT